MADRNPGASITAVELHPHRARLLQKLLSAFGTTAKIQIVVADALRLPTSILYDRVLADVPCSGTGTLARNPEIKWRLTANDIAHLRERQIAILRSALAQVASGGRLIYSTCSLEKVENEDVIEHALAQENSFSLVNCRPELDHLRAAGDLIWPDPGTLTRGPYLRTIPGIHPCDGFFAAILERKTM
jgi:16S rRNA (cytosine967-C5)-methyltransferase